MVMEVTFGEWVECVYFIFCSKYERSTLPSWFVVERRTSLKKWGFVTERFSYLVLRKGTRNEEDKPWPRILEHVKLRGRHVICKLCSSNGIFGTNEANTEHWRIRNWSIDIRHFISQPFLKYCDIEQKILTKKKDSDIYKCARHLSKWGDLMPITEDRKRPLKNPHVTLTRRGKLRK
ncbi:hypothetical protein AC249_AIPGENE19065 [Exaiptasia diaphana]|nr:hypothetical protein AC249_AIPGENE19065 [Exaiptasia diaphana]